MFTVNAMIHSLKAQDEAIILHEKDSNDVIAEYKGKRCTAIYNPYVDLYYIDDIYGEIPHKHQCPFCKEYIKATPHNYRTPCFVGACLHLFRHLAQISLERRQPSCAQFAQSDEKSDSAIARQ